jgi:hypothetical protein
MKPSNEAVVSSLARAGPSDGGGGKRKNTAGQIIREDTLYC